MSDHGGIFVGIFLVWPVIFALFLLNVPPRPMWKCVMAGYEWVDGDCVMKVKRRLRDEGEMANA